jgi:NAD(P)-dependent dehydrogenase (short-subunit alcohol dehydrogenase family)
MVRTWLITGGSQGLGRAPRAEVRAWAGVTRSTDLPA